jgi:hypothetical protein
MMQRLFIILILSGIVAINTNAQSGVDGRVESSNAIRTSVPFITIAPDSRAGAMGDAGVATSPDVNSQHWNVAKYPFIKESGGLALSYTPWLKGLGVSDLNLLYLSGFYKFGEKQVLSGGLRYFNLGKIVELDDAGEETGNDINPNEFCLDAGYSRQFSDYFGLGIAFRFIYSDIANGTSGLGTSSGGARYEPGTSFSADISAYYQKPIQIGAYDAEMAYGMNISNIGAKISYSDDKESQFIPTNMRLGGRLTLDIDEYNSIAATLDLNKLLVPSPPYYDSIEIGIIEGMFKSFGDAEGGGKEELHEIMWSGGLEYWYMNQFAIRTGYFNEYVSKGNRKYFTVGVGLALNVFTLDFSYLFPAVGGRNNPLANTMRFTLGFKFE